MQQGDDQLRFVGEGELPPDLEGVNWGAYGFSLIWSLLYGPKRWLFAFLGVVAVPLVADNIALLWFDSRTVFPAVQRATSPFLSIGLPLLAAAYALVVNREVWERERLRLESESYRPIALARYRKSIRFWRTLFLIMLAVNLLALVALVLLVQAPATSLLPGLNLVLAVGLLVFDRWRIRQRHS